MVNQLNLFKEVKIYNPNKSLYWNWFYRGNLQEAENQKKVKPQAFEDISIKQFMK